MTLIFLTSLCNAYNRKKNEISVVLRMYDKTISYHFLSLPPSPDFLRHYPNEGVILDTATTIAKPNFQRAAHDIIQKGAFPRRHTCTSKIIAKARKANHVFRSREGLSTHINTFDKCNCQARQIVHFCKHFLVS